MKAFAPNTFTRNGSDEFDVLSTMSATTCSMSSAQWCSWIISLCWLTVSLSLLTSAEQLIKRSRISRPSMELDSPCRSAICPETVFSNLTKREASRVLRICGDRIH